MAQTTPRGAALKFFQEAAKGNEECCVIWPYAKNAAGYAVFGKKRGRIFSSLVSRVMCSEVNGLPEDGRLEAAHTCGRGDAGCINPRHLVWKTSKQNKDDQIIHGTRNHGARNGGARLSENNVRAIRSLAGSMSQREIGARFGIDQSTVSNIVTGRLWRVAL